MTIHCSKQWWSPQESVSAAANFLLFFCLSGSTLFHFISAIFEGPGYLTLKWMPVINPHPSIILNYYYLSI